jgi:hypothetical protein
MKQALSLVLALLLGTPLSAQWVEGTRIGVNADNSKGPLAIYIGGYYEAWRDEHAIPRPMAPNVWHRITLDSIPTDTKAVFLSGLLIITPPTPLRVICDLRATFRAPGSTLHEDNYQLQTIEATELGGVRSNTATWVPVKDRTFEFFYRMTPGCASLINLSLQAYLR